MFDYVNWFLKKKAYTSQSRVYFYVYEVGPTLSVFQLVKVCIFLFIIVNDINYMYFAPFFICMAKRWHWKHNDKCVRQRFLLACLGIKVFYFDFTNIVSSVSIKSDLRNFLVSFDHASFGFVYKLAQVSMFNNKCSL